MKQCLKCLRLYRDETLYFCLEDGERLTEQGVEDEFFEYPTVNLPSANPLGTGRSAEEVVPPSTASNRNSLIAGLVGLLLITALGIGSYWYYGRDESKEIDSIAVIPFANLSGDPSTDYLSQGLPESLIYRLSQIPSLKVSPTSSVSRFRGSDDPLSAGRALGVDVVLSGRINQVGEGLLVSVELVDVRTNASLWGSQYDRKLTDVLSTQREIAREIAEALKIQVSRESGITKNYTNSNEAYLLQMQGRFLLEKRTKPEMDRALASFQKAILLDPNFALAYVGVAESYNAMVPYGYMKPSEAANESRTASKRALEIDPLLAEAHSAYAYVVGTYDWNWGEAEREHKRAIELNPDREGPHFYYAASFLVPTGRLDEAEAVLRKAIEIEPDSINGNVRLATVLRHARKTDEALAQARKANDMDPGALVGRGELMLCLTQKGLYDEAIRIGEASLVAAPDYPQVVTALGVAYARAGRPDEARKKLAEWEATAKDKAGYYARAARIYVALGEHENAIAALEKAFEERDWFILQARVAPEFDPLRDDPRFTALLARMGLP